MKKLMIAAALIAALPGAAFAQVDKQVEVTKAYVPNIGSAAKLPAVPDMTDTTRMRPDIDYTITPLTLTTSLVTRPIRPATVTYWEFNRPRSFYLKLGAGYPANSVADFYVSTQNPGTGYALGYINHMGRYADIRNDFGVKNNSTQMVNRIGVAAGKYFGRHTLEGEVSYDNRLYHRYGTYYPAQEANFDLPPGSRIDFGDANLALRFGDDFQDLTRTNFEVGLRAGLYMGYPEAYGWDVTLDPDTQSEMYRIKENTRQTTIEAHAKIARAFGRHRLSAEAGYERLAGQLAVDGNRQQQIHAALRYGIEGGVIDFEVGADYFHDRIDRNDDRRSKSYVIPFLRLDFDLGTPGLKPFFALDGGVYDNSHRALTRQNPYADYKSWGDRSSVDYNGRFGLGGSIWRNRFNYRAYAAFSIRDNHAYWYGLGVEDVAAFGPAYYEFARQTVTSINGEIEWRPVSALLLSLGVHGYIYNDDTQLENGSPAFKGNVGLRYEGRKIAFGVSAVMQSTRKWTMTVGDFGQDSDILALGFPADGAFTAPFATDLRVDFDWKISRSVSLFAEGRNLANQKLYEFPWHPEYGANFTLGVKLNF